MIIIETQVIINSYWIDDSPDGVRIRLSRAFIDRILQLSEIVQFYHIERTVEFDSTPEFLYEGKTDDEVEYPMRSELTSLNVCDMEYFWSGVVKHSDPEISWETAWLPISELQELVKVWDTPKSRLPLLMNSLNHRTAQRELEKLLK